jgi:transposase-like protein
MSYLIETATPEAIEAYEAGKGSIASLARRHGLKYSLLHGRIKLGKRPAKGTKTTPHEA